MSARVPSFYFGSLAQRQRARIDLPDATLSVEEQELQARVVLSGLDASKPPSWTFREFITRRDPAERAEATATAQLCELLDRFGWSCWDRRGPLGECITELLKIVITSVPEGRRRFVFAAVSAHCHAQEGKTLGGEIYGPEACYRSLLRLGDWFARFGGW